MSPHQRTVFASAATIGDMAELNERMPYRMAFPGALGTGIIVQTSRPDPGSERMRAFIDGYEAALSRFRADSTVCAMSQAAHGGHFDFPDWAAGLFDLYDLLFDATQGAIDPCVGEDLIRLGYDARYSFTVDADAWDHLGSAHGRAVWRDAVERHGSTLITSRPVSLDFGACGKGYLVDLLGRLLLAGSSSRNGTTAGAGMRFLINAGSDLLSHDDQPVAIALEDPGNPANAVGTASVDRGSFCASAPSRRRWGEAAGHRLHHLLNAIDGLPADDVMATWVYVADSTGTVSGSDAPLPRSQASGIPAPNRYPTATADGVATALFTTPAERLRERCTFACAILNADRTAAKSAGFPGAFFAK